MKVSQIYLIPPERNAKTIIARPCTNGINDGTLAALQTPTNTKIMTTKNSAKHGRTYFMNTEERLGDEVAALFLPGAILIPFSAAYLLLFSLPSILYYFRCIARSLFCQKHKPCYEYMSAFQLFIKRQLLDM